MTYLTIILLAFALSVDACIVSFSYGLAFDKGGRKNALSLALCTGLFQGIMPAISYFLTGFIKEYVQPYSKFIILFIFLYLGIKFIIESFGNKTEKELCIDLKCLILIGIATSIDAFSAGISLSLTGCRIVKPSMLIAFVTFVNSYAGYIAGNKFKALPSRTLEIIAGLLLIFLGIRAAI